MSVGRLPRRADARAHPPRAHALPLPAVLLRLRPRGAAGARPRAPARSATTGRGPWPSTTATTSSRETEPLGEKLARVLAAAGRPAPASATLVTAARFFGHVFNPASFFFCRDAAGRLDCVLVQVRNTFGDMHLYLLPGGGPAPPGYAIAGGADKVFHVSPFFPRSGSYEFLISEPSPELDVVIRYRDGGRQVFAARLRATARPLTGGALLRTIARRPLTAWLSVPRIVWQAARLHWQRRLPVFTRPEPASPMTVRRAPAPPPGPLERIGRRAILAFWTRLRPGAAARRASRRRGAHLRRPGRRPHGRPAGPPQRVLPAHALRRRDRLRGVLRRRRLGEPRPHRPALPARRAHRGGRTGATTASRPSAPLRTACCTASGRTRSGGAGATSGRTTTSRTSSSRSSSTRR